MAGTAGTPGTPRVLRAMNDRAALDLLLEHGPLSRTRIGKLTGLSKPTASQLLARLEAAGLVLATGTTEGRPGPSAQLYEVNPAAGHAAGLDVTPQRILAAVAIEAKGSDEQFRIDALAPYIRLRDSRNLRLLVKRLLKSSAV